MKSPESNVDNQENPSPKKTQSLRLPQRLLLILLPIALTIGGVAILVKLLARQNNSSPNTTVKKPLISVKLAEAKVGKITESSEFIASLQSLNSETLQANVQGKISQIFVKKGNQVAAQAPLLQISSSNQPAQTNNNSASNGAAVPTIKPQLQNARAQLQELQAQQLSKIQSLKLIQQQYEKYSNLASQGAVSKQAKDEYAKRLEAAKIDLNNLNTKIAAQQAAIFKLEQTLQQAQIQNTATSLAAPKTPSQLQQSRIKAPFKGTVANILVKVGDSVKPSTRVVTVTQNQPLEVDIPVSLEKQSQLRKGMLIEIIDSKGKKIGTGKVFFIAPEVNSNTRTILVKALFDNTQRKMRAGQFAKARINWNQDSGLLIPTTAVFRIAGEAFVYVAQRLNSTAPNSQLVARQKQVKLGKTVGNQYQVIEGLQPGEKVIVSRLLNINNGDILTAE
ncbi:RND family efflux transporter, MFP subunit [Rivularia sp. PCC 7116]|uniref:efflux RND transporter periplasmic adaptor subunit n=1 Tax=Rivularia sp. PCC 7116 TaxID=373994 RepID=UPI00029EDB66|nr:efflux RND transporter periplasmic adaptor subunit [Rivularia sp. PCC 7116]AFY58230.1 RND family efflux transporter, MFP subunit [Rivularia sp. PCC 7116]